MLAILEVFGWSARAVLDHKGYSYSPPQKPGKRTYLQAQAARDPRVGWPEVGELGGASFDASGARRSPAYPHESGARACIEAYGDSFTFGWAVPHAEVWSELLAKMIGCRVANFAVPGYGDDQALLRLRARARPDHDAKVVIFGHMTENIQRLLTRLRDLITGAQDYAFKPRFILDAQGALQLVPLPRISEQEYRQAVGLALPLRVLPHESFAPGGSLHAPLARFPFFMSFVDGVGDYRARARLAGNRPPYASLYEPGHVTGALELLVAIIVAAEQSARAQGQHFMVAVLPETRDLRYFARTGRWVHGPLLAALDRAGIAYLDFGPVLVDRGPAQLADQFVDNHYSPAVHGLLARSVLSQLRERGWVPPPKP